MNERMHGVRYSGKIRPVGQRFSFDGDGHLITEEVDELLGPSGLPTCDSNGEPIPVEIHRPPNPDKGSIIE